MSPDWCGFWWPWKCWLATWVKRILGRIQHTHGRLFLRIHLTLCGWVRANALMWEGAVPRCHERNLVLKHTCLTHVCAFPACNTPYLINHSDSPVPSVNVYEWWSVIQGVPAPPPWPWPGPKLSQKMNEWSHLYALWSPGLTMLKGHYPIL